MNPDTPTTPIDPPGAATKPTRVFKDVCKDLEIQSRKLAAETDRFERAAIKGKIDELLDELNQLKKKKNEC